MADKRYSLILVIALVVAAGSGYGVYRLLQQAQSASRVPTASIVVAATDLSDGQVITTADVKIISMPIAAAPVDAYTVSDSVVGRVTRIPVFAGEAFVPGRLAPVGTGAGLEVKIAPGKRAMAVKIDEVAGLAGLIQPNSRVDVLLTVVSAQGVEQRAKLIMSNMRVLSIGAQVERGPDGRPMNATTAALEVTPLEAEQLAIAANQGRIQLVLRGYGDPDTVETRGATVSDVMRASGSSASPAPAPERSTRRTTARRSTTSEPPPAPAPVASPPPAPRRQDSSVVQVYRRDKVSQQKVERRDSLPPL